MSAEAALKRQVRADAARRGLASVMNETRWRELRQAVEAELAFPPPYRRQDVLGPPVVEGPDEQPTYWGDWSDGALAPFVSIEWVRIFPERWDRAGRLTPLVVVEDCRAGLEAILRRYAIPWTPQGRALLIRGYVAPGDDAGRVHD